MSAKLPIKVGDVFERLTVVSEPVTRQGERAVEVVCTCGTRRWALVSQMYRGGIKSCGCLKLEKSVARIRSARKPRRFPEGSERAQGVWKQMLDRCCNPKSDVWHLYGGRGITVCEDWKDFHTFYADMGTAPKGYQLDRRDNDGPYSKENCHWVTITESLKNRRITLWVEYNGVLVTLTELSALVGIPYDPLYRRYRHYAKTKDLKQLIRPVAKRTKRK